MADATHAISPGVGRWLQGPTRDATNACLGAPGISHFLEESKGLPSHLAATSLNHLLCAARPLSFPLPSATKQLVWSGAVGQGDT